MSHRPSLIACILGASCLPLAAQLHRTLEPTKVTASASGGAGEGDHDETVLSPDDLARFDVSTLEEFSALAPNLHFVTSDNRGYGNVVSMRGLANTLFFGPPAVGFYVDDVPFGDAFTYASNLLRLDSARVHHGPQGASFGRNASGGLIELTTLQPTSKFVYGGSVEYGSYDSYGVTAYSAGPLSDTLSHSFQFYWKERDGFVRNVTLNNHPDDRSVIGGLASIVYTPSADTEIKFRVMVEQVDDGGQRLTAIPGNFNPNAIVTDPFQVASNLAGGNESERYQLSLHARRDFAWGTFKSITSYQNWDLGPQVVDLDLSTGFPTLGGPLNFSSTINQEQELWTQEFRFQSDSDGPLSWHGGLFFMHKENTGSTLRDLGLGTEAIRFDIDEENYAAFAKAAYQLNPNLSVEAGIRAEHTEASMNRTKVATSLLGPAPVIPGQAPSADATYFSPTGGLIYDFNNDLSAFARTGIGTKSHGFTAFSDNPANSGFGEERNWSNEIGFQYQNAEENLNMVLRGFWNEIDDYHLNVSDPNPQINDFIIVNAEEVRSRGVEAEIQWRPIEPLLLHGTAGWTDIEFDAFSDPFTAVNHAGNTVPFIPEFTASAGFRYDLGGGFFIGSSIRATEDTHYDAANTINQAGYWIWNAQAGYEAENWSITVFGRNLLDEEYYTFIDPSILAGSPGDPQIFGVRVNLDIW